MLVSVVVLLVAVVGAAMVVGSGGREETSSRGDSLRPADVEPDTAVPQPVPLAIGLDVTVWAGEVADRSVLPQRALQAYARAELAQRAATPDCRLAWTTLAGIGRVESDHGRLYGAEPDADGVVRPSIIGIALDGTRGTLLTPDTDGGTVDGDTTYDRAVGPMQFLPATWARYGADGNGDGIRDPHQFDDAARGAAAYLCADGRNTASGEGWWNGVLTYNRSVDYARLVWAAADRYATAA